MTFPFPYGGITVEVERATYDRFNDPSGYSYHQIANCIEFPSGSSEAGPNVGISDVRTLLAPAGADIQATDRVVLPTTGEKVPPALGSPIRRACTYQVSGRPKDWTHAMTGWHPGMTVELERIS